MLNRPFVDRLSRIGFIPIIDMEAPEQVPPLAGALANGGISALALSVSLPDCAPALKTIRETMPDVLAGLCVAEGAPAPNGSSRIPARSFFLSRRPRNAPGMSEFPLAFQ